MEEPADTVGMIAASSVESAQKRGNMNIDETIMTFDEAMEKIQKAMVVGLVSSGTRTKLMGAIRSRKQFVVGTSKRVPRLNENVFIISEKDFDDIFPQSGDKCVFVDETGVNLPKP